MNSEDKKKALFLALGIATTVSLAVKVFSSSSTSSRVATSNSSRRLSSSERRGAGSRSPKNRGGSADKDSSVNASPNAGAPLDQPIATSTTEGGVVSSSANPPPPPRVDDFETASVDPPLESERDLRYRLSNFTIRSPSNQQQQQQQQQYRTVDDAFSGGGGASSATGGLRAGGGGGARAADLSGGVEMTSDTTSVGGLGAPLSARGEGEDDYGHQDDDNAFSYEDSISSLQPRNTPGISYQKGRRNTVVGHSTNLDETRMYQPQTQPKTQQEKDHLFQALAKCHLFAHLDEEEVNSVVDTMERCLFSRGEFITKAGEIQDSPDSHKFYVVLEGEISVIEDRTVVRLLCAGSCFGESHIMFIQPRSLWTYRVDTTNALCFSLDANSYRHIVTRAAVNKRELYEGFLDRVSWLKGLTRREKLQLADCLQPVVYQDGHYLIEYNTLGEWVFVILEGSVDVFGRDSQGEVLNVCSFGVGDCVGELEFINHHRTVADVRAKGRVKAARLHREHFEMCMGPIVEVLKRTATADARYAYYQSVIRTMRRAE